MSAMVPPPMVRGAAPAAPARKRKPMSMLKVLLTPQAIVKTTKSALHVWYNGSRPYSSLSGATRSGPKAKPRRYTDTTKVERRSECWSKCLMSSGTPGAKEDDPSGLEASMSAALRSPGARYVRDERDR